MPSYVPRSLMSLFLLLCLTIPWLEGQENKEKKRAASFFGHDPNTPVLVPPELLLTPEQARPLTVDKIPGGIDGRQNPEAIPEYMVWGDFFSVVHRAQQAPPGTGSHPRLQILPESRTLEEAVGLTPDQFQSLIRLAEQCVERVQATQTLYKNRVDTLLRGRDISALSEPEKKKLADYGRQAYEENKATILDRRVAVLELLDTEQQAALRSYLLATVARSIQLVPLRKP